MKALAALTLAAAALTLSAPASAQFAKAEDAIKYRQSALFVMGQHFGRLGAMANGRRRSMPRWRRRTPTSWPRWPSCLGLALAPAPTRARPQGAARNLDRAGQVQGHSEKLEAETVKLAAAAKTGNLDNLKTAFGAAAGTCKACHDSFRAK